MAFPPDSQNILVCILLAAGGGAFEVLATVVVAIPDAREKQGHLITGATLRRAIVTNVILQIIASVLGNTMSTWFGPVSIAGPVFFASQMVANMIVFGFLTGLEAFSKEMRVGTWVVVIGTLMIIVNGPQSQDDQDVNELVTEWYALLWSGILLGGMAISSIYMALGVNRFKSEYTRAAILLAARGCALSVNLTVSKPFSMEPGIPMVFVWLAFKIISGAVYAIAIIIQSTAVNQSTFVPLNTTVTLLLNAITGIIIWEDWRTVESWLGYMASFTLLILGIYLILGDVDLRLFTSENPIYGQGGKFQRMRAKRNLLEDFADSDGEEDQPETDQPVIENDVEEVQVKEEGEEEEKAPHVKFQDQFQDEPEAKVKMSHRRSTRPGFQIPASMAMTKKDCWATIIGAGPDFITRHGGAKRQSIFFSGRPDNEDMAQARKADESTESDDAYDA